MILTTHALVGAALGKYVHNPITLTIILIPLHYILDIFRHGEYLNKKSTFKDTTWKVLLDLSIALVIILLSAYFSRINKMFLIPMLVGSFISMFPDLLTVLYWKFNFKFLKKIYHFHQFVHRRFADGSKEREWTMRNFFNDFLLSAIAILFMFL